MNPAITFRKATPNDAQTLADVRIRFTLELSGEQPADAIEALRGQMAANFLKNTLSGSCISVFAECGTDVAGIGSVHIREVPGNFRNPSGMWGYIMNMYTFPKYRKQGICNRILQLLQDEAQRVGVTAFELHATEPGKPVYERNGFRIHDQPTLRKFYQAP